MQTSHWIRRQAIALSILLLVFSSAVVCAQSSTSASGALPRSVPELEGISSEGIRAFLDSFEGTPHEMHSLMLLRHGKVVVEGWWAPYAPELTHSMYSTSKTFTATAIGIASGEGLLSVEDTVISFFPDSVPDPLPQHLADLRVKHLLSMTVGHEPDPTRAIVGVSDDWVKMFLATPIVKEPGSTFLYNSMATYMLSAIITKVTGERVIDYLTPRLFKPLGVSGIDWETDPLGNNTGGWGLRLHTEDMAKLGQLYLQNGVWNGTRLLPEGWVAEATSAKILQEPDRPAEFREKSDWHQGYGYQIWRCRNDAYRGDGAFGQYIVVMPQQDAVLAITSQTSDMQGILDLVWEHLLSAIGDRALEPNPDSHAALRDQLAKKKLTPPEGERAGKRSRDFNGKSFSVEANGRNISKIGFEFESHGLNVTFEDARGRYTIPFGAEEWKFSGTERHGPYLVAAARNSLMGLPAFKVACSYRWIEDGGLELTLRYIESPHTETLTCTLDGDTLNVQVSTGASAPFNAQGSLTDKN